MFSYIVWLFAFCGGVVGTYFVPDAAIPLEGKFVLIGAWGAVLGFIYYSIAKRKAQDAEADFTETLNEIKQAPRTQYVPVVPTVAADEHKVNTPIPPVRNPFESILPPGAMPVRDALAKAEKRFARPVFPLEKWNLFCKEILKNRPFPEVIEALEKVLPSLFPKAAGILYMYGDVQSELCKIFSFGDYVISDDKIMPMECASFNKGDIVVTDYKSGKFNGGCTHLHHHPQGVSFCAPIEGLEEHFGILTIQVDQLPEGEDLEFWKAKVSIVSATFGLYVANQNLNIRFQQHSIRDGLTGLFNKRYMEESLRREIFSAARHKTPIGIIMMYPDNVQQIQSSRGRHAVDQLLWELGQRLPNFIRNEDIPCRYDGDVLCVIMPGAELKITRDRAEKIRNEISQLQISYGDAVLSTTLSLGVSVLPVHATDIETLICAAEASMQMASNRGGNRVILADALQQR